MPANKSKKTPVFFHTDQLNHKPLFEWAFGQKIKHPETTSRAESILKSIQANPATYDLRAPKRFPLDAIKGIHNTELSVLYKRAKSLPKDKTMYPSVFPKRDLRTADPTRLQHAGYYCFDSGTPLNSTTWSAAAWSAACAVETTKAVATGESKMAYGLCRPPGHHAGESTFGGYCYLNNAAIAAHLLRSQGRVLILDIDFHHGNGTQSIFYKNKDVFTVSIHGDPKDYFPFYCGHENERGEGIGKNHNLNITSPTGTDGQEYMRILQKKILPIVKKFQPKFLVLCAGFDTYVSDPIGGFALETEDYHDIGGFIAKLGLPTIVLQEGGYEAKSLGRNVHSLLSGFNDFKHYL